jgi:hypothetical protein
VRPRAASAQPLAHLVRRRHVAVGAVHFAPQLRLQPVGALRLSETQQSPSIKAFSFTQLNYLMAFRRSDLQLEARELQLDRRLARGHAQEAQGAHHQRQHHRTRKGEYLWRLIG